jgi:lysophospholipase L1-like esterase
VNMAAASRVQAHALLLRRPIAVALLALLVGALPAVAADPAAAAALSARVEWKFDFGPGKPAPGYTQVLPTTVYSKDLGYGFEFGSQVSGVDRGGDDPLRGDFCTSDRPFFFSVDLPEGNYNVTLTLGDAAGESTTTVKAESRRLMLERVHTAPGKFETRRFTVNVHAPHLPGGGEVRLNPRERGLLHWDDKLTLEFSDARPCVCAVEIKRNDAAVTVFLAGDSTVTDQPREPWNSWGQMLPRFLGPGVAVANYAESGESLKSFAASKRIEKVVSSIRKGDYLFIQFGHNDQKEKGPGVGAFTTYEQSLRHFAAEARRRGATVVLVTPVNRRTFDATGHITNSLADYCEAVRQAAKEDDLPVIDLNAMSKPFYEALGPEGSKKAFVDNTHHNNYGSYELTRCVVEGIRQNKLPLAEHLADDVQPFDPAHPDRIESFKLPASPQAASEKPEGN